MHCWSLCFFSSPRNSNASAGCSVSSLSNLSPVRGEPFSGYDSIQGMAIGLGVAFLSCFVGLATSLFLRAYAEQLRRKELDKEPAEVEIPNSWKNSAVCNCAAKSYCQLTGSWGKKSGATGRYCQLKWVILERIINATSSWIFWRRYGSGGRIWTCDLRINNPIDRSGLMLMFAGMGAWVGESHHGDFAQDDVKCPVCEKTYKSANSASLIKIFH